MDFGVYDPELRDIMDEAMVAPLTYEQLAKLPLHTRCRLIRHMTQELLRDKNLDWNHLATDSLAYIGRSFNVSGHYIEWQDNRTKRLLQRLKHREFRPTLNILKHWHHASDAQRKETLQTTTRLHQRVFMEGISDPLPISHSFTELKPRRRTGGITVLFGTFVGDLERARGRIKQNTHVTASFDDAFSALDTAHHEMDHGIHFSLAVEYHRGRVRADHPLHDDAQYFHAVEVRGAGIPPAIPEAYGAQTFEVLADREGRAIAAGIYGLAL